MEDSGNAYITTDTQIKYLARVREGRRCSLHHSLPRRLVPQHIVCRSLNCGDCGVGFDGYHIINNLQLVGVEGAALKEALTHKKIIAKGEEVSVAGLLSLANN